eukprot:jgi/Botrbrau1/4474/Bobra.0220s0008.1
MINPCLFNRLSSACQLVTRSAITRLVHINHKKAPSLLRQSRRIGSIARSLVRGKGPKTGQPFFLSVYLDRLLFVDQQNYGFHASMFLFLSWRDPNAFEKVKSATAAYQAGNDSCSRHCNGQLASGPLVQCCDTLWLPTFVVRNVDEFPQGRVQPYYITVSADGIVTWRVQFNCRFYVPMSMEAFPFDKQELMVKLQMFQLEGAAPHYHCALCCRLAPPAGPAPAKQLSSKFVMDTFASLKLFTMGRGDDLSGWKVDNLTVTVNEQGFSDQFKMHNIRKSLPDDPAPLLGGEGNPNPNFNVGTVVDVQIRLLITRLSNYFSLGTILPVLVCTSLSFLTFFIQPEQIDTRLQLVVTLFLALVAIQFVVEQELPRASYVIPTRQLVIASYGVLGIISVETLVVFNIAQL